MTILVTGAAGFLGSRLIRALLERRQGFAQVDRIVAVDLAPGPVEDDRVVTAAGSIEDLRFVGSLVQPGLDVVFHLAAVLSGEAEADFDLGMRVNVDATRGLLEACRALPRPVRFVFTSTIAVFGGPLPAVLPEDMVLRPESSYGTEKAIAELLVCDYSRRGFVDGIALRVPTVAIRPGRPNSALSSFVSGIVREPLAGIESVCPVPLDTRLWVTSPSVVTDNLLRAGRVPADALEGVRTLNMPGITVTPGQLLDSLERFGGTEARALVRVEPAERVARVVCSWPGAFDTRRARRLGFVADRSVDGLVEEFLAERASQA